MQVRHFSEHSSSQCCSDPDARHAAGCQTAHPWHRSDGRPHPWCVALHRQVCTQSCHLLFLCAAELHVELLTRVLLEAAGLDPQLSQQTAFPVHHLLLARWSTVCKAWAAAAEAAAQALTSVSLSAGMYADELANLPAAALQPNTSYARWARHWTSLSINTNAELQAGPELPSLLRSNCSQLQALELDSDGSHLSTARLQAVAAAVPGLQRLACRHYLPFFGVPTGLRQLSIITRACQDWELEVLMVHASALLDLDLQELSVSMWGGLLLLRAANLPAVQLGQLRVLQLSVNVFNDLGWVELSFLASPRAFELCPSGVSRTAASLRTGSSSYSNYRASSSPMMCCT